MDAEKFLERTYTELNDNIKFSEAKNAVLITLNSALIAVGAEKVFDSSILFKWRALIAFVVLLLLIPTVLSIFSFRAKTDSEYCIIQKIYDKLWAFNSIKEQPEKLMYYAYISKHFKNDPEKYFNKITGENNCSLYTLQLSRQIVDLSTVAYNKFLLFNFAITIECILFATGGIIALITVIVKCFPQL